MNLFGVVTCHDYYIHAHGMCFDIGYFSQSSAPVIHDSPYMEAMSEYLPATQEPTVELRQTKMIILRKQAQHHSLDDYEWKPIY